MNILPLNNLEMIELIPAIDLIDGKCVRLIQGDYGQKTIYNENRCSRETSKLCSAL